MADSLLQLERVAPPAASRDPHERGRLERRAKLLAWGGNAWHLVEFAIAVTAGIIAGSVALIGFGADSLIEFAAGAVIVWLFSGGRGTSVASERRAQQLIAASYFVLAAYIGVESIRDLIVGHHPNASWVGIGLAAFDVQDLQSDARSFLRHHDVRYASVRDNSGVTYDGYGLTGVPETFWLDARGRIVAHYAGAVSSAQLESGVRAAGASR